MGKESEVSRKPLYWVRETEFNIDEDKAEETRMIRITQKRQEIENYARAKLNSNV